MSELYFIQSTYHRTGTKKRDAISEALKAAKLNNKVVNAAMIEGIKQMLEQAVEAVNKAYTRGKELKVERWLNPYTDIDHLTVRDDTEVVVYDIEKCEIFEGDGLWEACEAVNRKLRIDN